jgi:hypothetical protein
MRAVLALLFALVCVPAAQAQKFPMYVVCTEGSEGNHFIESIKLGDAMFELGTPDGYVMGLFPPREHWDIYDLLRSHGCTLAAKGSHFYLIERFRLTTIERKGSILQMGLYRARGHKSIRRGSRTLWIIILTNTRSTSAPHPRGFSITRKSALFGADFLCPFAPREIESLVFIVVLRGRLPSTALWTLFLR